MRATADHLDLIGQRLASEASRFLPLSVEVFRRETLVTLCVTNARRSSGRVQSALRHWRRKCLAEIFHLEDRTARAGCAHREATQEGRRETITLQISVRGHFVTLFVTSGRRLAITITLEEVTCCEDTSEKQMGFLAEPVRARW